jgi:hypothetical protein
MLSEVLPGVGTEILAFALDDSFHGRRQGSAFLDALLTGPLKNKPVYARCHLQSQRLYEMLIRRGFTHPQNGEHGVRFLMRLANSARTGGDAKPDTPQVPPSNGTPDAHPH